MKKIFNLLYSTRLMAVLFIVFATAMGYATFIENDYGIQTAKVLIYDAWWFEAIMVFFVINFVGNIFRYKLLRIEKFWVLVFHLAFIFILIGAGVTRYVGYEGYMLIDEGQTTNKYLSETTYVNVVVDNGINQRPQINKPIQLSAKGTNSWSFSNNFTDSITNQDFDIKLIDYIPWAAEKMVADENGNEHLFLVESSDGSRHEHWIKKGTIQNIHGILVGFGVGDDNASINFSNDDGILKITSKSDGDWLRMADQERGKIVKDSTKNFNYLSLHNIAGLQFVIPRPAEKGVIKAVRGKKDDTKYDQIVLEISSNNEKKQVALTGGKFNNGNVEKISVDGLNFRMWYGAKNLELPFNLKLNDFQLDTYPGSKIAESYASEITVIDKNEIFDYRIFMNHILDYKGYKFFQSSYDIDSEIEQTKLSVNHDFWGTFITYLGYSLLYTGLICILFAKHTRFASLKKSLKKLQKKKETLSIIGTLFLSSLTFAQYGNHQQNRISERQIDSILQVNKIDISHAEKFNKLVIQDAGGRMKPAHTFASELLRKVSRTKTLHGMEASQILLSIIENPRFWFEVPMIYLEEGNYKIREILDLSEDAEFARLSDFYDSKGISKIDSYIDEAQKKNVKNKFEKDVIKIGERLYLLTSALSGKVLKIFPIPGDENNTWVSQPETFNANFTGKDSIFVRKSLRLYVQLLQNAKRTKNYEKADKILNGIKKFQQTFGAAIYPSEQKIELEIAYNKLSVFKSSGIFYLILGIFLIIIEILRIFYFKSNLLKWVGKGLTALIILVFLYHTFGLGLRWCISGNAPWSNAFESIIYVAFATMLFGLSLGKKSNLTIGATTFVAAIILLFAHQNWLNPEIANLQAVLNSWWLLVHVSIIVASYGPFTLSMILGIVSMILIIFTTKNNKKRMLVNLKELTVINEMAMTIGLIMLTIGNFLGGMWANESWGRYWGWDPKETWALVSIMVYAFVLHLRLIPGLKNRLTFNFWSTFAYLSIMMTYFGVNFYLSGLHSYASGDKVVTPKEAFIYTGFIIVLMSLGHFKYKEHYKK